MMLMIGLCVSVWIGAGLVAVLLNFSLEDRPFPTDERWQSEGAPDIWLVALCIFTGLLSLLWVGVKGLTRGLWKAKLEKISARTAMELELAKARKEIDDFLNPKPEAARPAEPPKPEPPKPEPPKPTEPTMPNPRETCQHCFMSRWEMGKDGSFLCAFCKLPWKFNPDAVLRR